MRSYDFFLRHVLKFHHSQLLQSCEQHWLSLPEHVRYDAVDESNTERDTQENLVCAATYLFHLQNLVCILRQLQQGEGGQIFRRRLLETSTKILVVLNKIGTNTAPHLRPTCVNLVSRERRYYSFLDQRADAEALVLHLRTVQRSCSDQGPAASFGRISSRPIASCPKSDDFLNQPGSVLLTARCRLWPVHRGFTCNFEGTRSVYVMLQELRWCSLSLLLGDKATMDERCFDGRDRNRRGFLVEFI
jgi:hypothetical protein